MKIMLKLHGEILPPSMIKLGYSSQVILGLDADTLYVVYGISIWRDVIHYLIIPSDYTLPFWFPADLFDVVEKKMPCNWYFRYMGGENPNELKMIIGYKEMVLDKTHYFDLIERETCAVRTFLTQKKEIDEIS